MKTTRTIFKLLGLLALMFAVFLCTASLDRKLWREQLEQELISRYDGEQQSVNVKTLDGSELAEQYYGDRELWHIIEKANGKHFYGMWDIEKKKYKGGVTITIPPKPEEAKANA